MRIVIETDTLYNKNLLRDFSKVFCKYYHDNPDMQVKNMEEIRVSPPLAQGDVCLAPQNSNNNIRNSLESRIFGNTPDWVNCNLHLTSGQVPPNFINGGAMTLNPI